MGPAEEFLAAPLQYGTNAFMLQHQAWNLSYKAEAEDREFKTSLRNLVRPCLQNKNKNGKVELKI